MRLASTLRARLFWVLLLTAVIPSGLILVGGALVIREGVMVTGSAGPWGVVADSGQELIEAIEAREEPDGELVAAAARHREQLSESVRQSRLFSYLAERSLALLPAAVGLLLLLAAGLALLAATLLSRSLSAPVARLVDWTRRLGDGQPLPEPGEAGGPSLREIEALEMALRTMDARLAEARRQEVRRAKMQSWSQMARQMAHELKNPLMPMQMAARTVARASDPAVSEAGQVLVEEIARLDTMARTLSQFGRTPEGPPSEVDMGELVQQVVGRLAGAGAGVELAEAQSDLMIWGHPVMLERVVRNLVSNALEASEESGAESGPVRVELARIDCTARLRVLDRGSGLPARDTHRIWEPDFSTRRKGTGLGLPMVRQVVEAHNGDVRAADRDGGGAVFEVVLPLHDPNPEAHPA